MNQSEKRIWLIQQLLNEKPEYMQYQIPQDEQGQKDLLRALMNVRMPDPMDDEFLRIQDDYLREETNRKGTVELSGLFPWRRDDRIYLWQGDMSRLQAEAVVNPCNDSAQCSGDSASPEVQRTNADARTS